MAPHFIFSFLSPCLLLEYSHKEISMRRPTETVKEANLHADEDVREAMGCPHEEGEDFPLGEDCPFCPFWKGKQGSNRQGSPLWQSKEKPG